MRWFAASVAHSHTDCARAWCLSRTEMMQLQDDYGKKIFKVCSQNVTTACLLTYTNIAARSPLKLPSCAVRCYLYTFPLLSLSIGSAVVAPSACTQACLSFS